MFALENCFLYFEQFALGVDERVVLFSSIYLFLLFVFFEYRLLKCFISFLNFFEPFLFIFVSLILNHLELFISQFCLHLKLLLLLFKSSFYLVVSHLHSDHLENIVCSLIWEGNIHEFLSVSIGIEGVHTVDYLGVA